MMRLLFLFFIYSFVGWILETVAAALKLRKIVNRGFLNGPLCMIYGAAGALLAVTLPGLKNDHFFLFLGSMIYATVMELLSGKILEARYHARWWDYSSLRFNFDGYICLSHSLLWGALGVTTVKWINPFLFRLFDLVPVVIRTSLLWTCVGITVVDLLGVDAALSGNKKHMERYRQSNRMIAQTTATLRSKIAGGIERRVAKAHPVYEEKEIREQEKKAAFAVGCGFYKVFWLFIIGAFIGDLVETLFCRVTMGWWMSRSSVVWGPFSLVWGLAIAVFTALLYQHRNKSESFLFVAGTLLGGAFEYFCSVFTEVVFGTIFWDYSKVPFNLMGRINLLYCFFWGIAAVVWFKVVYIHISDLIETIPVKAGKILTWVVALFMVVDVSVSAMALSRYQERQQGIAATSTWQKAMDKHFDDAYMKKIYPKAKMAVDRGKAAEL